MRHLLTQTLISPSELAHELPASRENIARIIKTREIIRQIINRQDSRRLVILGPCSIHDPVAALEYAKIIQIWQMRFEKQLCLVMRCYFEKPRTEPNWKGFLHDPDLNDAGNLPKGLTKARQLLLDINQLGVACATEFIDPIAAAYWTDLIAWAAIGARTSQSQIHRELASGLPMPVGFKNSPSGNIQAAIDALRVARNPQTSLGINQKGQAAFIRTQGNPDSHLILRGTDRQPNYQMASAQFNQKLVDQLTRHNLNPHIMIDCSHGNSQKDHNRQYDLALELSDRLSTDQPIMGLMLESFLKPGKQTHSSGIKTNLSYGVSITDACMGITQTETVLQAYAQLPILA
jgi:3-deoxy-7-phosphoheptulonate synthase